MLCDPPIRYDVVIWVESSRSDTVQEKICEKIRPSDEPWKKKVGGEMAQDIYRILSQRKFVLLLDDVWKLVNLKDVGIPNPSRENGSKVVLTTRLSHVCRAMRAQRIIEVKCLGEPEAWTLFQQKVTFTNSDPEVREVAKSVAAECGGLPLALDIIGRAMTGKTRRESWDFAKKVLKNSAHKFVEIRKLYSVLSDSYETLLRDRMKSCFLYSSLFPEGSPILKSSLINYWFGEGLLDMFESINDALTHGHYVIEQLVSANLFQQDEKDDYVKLHDVIRDMALWIACGREAAGKRFLVQAGLQLTEAPKVGNWKDMRRMSLMQNEIKNLSFIPRCPKIETLFLNSNDLQVIKGGFFQSIRNLRVLNLSDNRNLTRLPEGISELVSLECLDLSSTGLRELPIKLESLSKLKLLDLKNIKKMERIPQKLIRSF
ncbi:Leucine-rich repeat - like 10 [Theobroma cacao]|nr:Leucine-rich repeat - like 10 [Theobroma cacao]